MFKYHLSLVLLKTLCRQINNTKISPKFFTRINHLFIHVGWCICGLVDVSRKYSNNATTCIRESACIEIESMRKWCSLYNHLTFIQQNSSLQISICLYQKTKALARLPSNEQRVSALLPSLRLLITKTLISLGPPFK